MANKTEFVRYPDNYKMPRGLASHRQINRLSDAIAGLTPALSIGQEDVPFMGQTHSLGQYEGMTHQMVAQLVDGWAFDRLHGIY